MNCCHGYIHRVIASFSFVHWRSLGCISWKDITTFQNTRYGCLREDSLWTQMKFHSVVRTLNNANCLCNSAPYLHLLWYIYIYFFFCLCTDDYEQLRTRHSARIATKAITCCDRDKEASSPCRKLIDWAVKKREMPFKLGSEGQRAWDTFILYVLLC